MTPTAIAYFVSGLVGVTVTTLWVKLVWTRATLFTQLIGACAIVGIAVIILLALPSA